MQDHLAGPHKESEEAVSEISITYYNKCLLGHELVAHVTQDLCPLCELALYRKALFLACHKIRNLDREDIVAGYNELYFLMTARKSITKYQK